MTCPEFLRSALELGRRFFGGADFRILEAESMIRLPAVGIMRDTTAFGSPNAAAYRGYHEAPRQHHHADEQQGNNLQIVSARTDSGEFACESLPLFLKCSESSGLTKLSEGPGIFLTSAISGENLKV
jgi:hypothetical protein